jgi:hypothetical protein
MAVTGMDDLALVAYVVLVVFTLAFALLAWINVRRFGGMEHMLIAGVLYYYSLFGGWKILSLKTGYGVSDALEHLEYALGAVRIDGDYIVSLLIYGIFGLAILGGIWLSGRPAWRATVPSPAWQPQAPSLNRLILLASAALIASVLALGTEIVEALRTGASVYLFTRTEPGKWFTVHQLCNRMGLAALACAWPVLILHRNQWRWPVAVILLVISGVWLGYLGLLGNRNELAVAVCGAFLFYVLLGGSVRIGKLLAVVGGAYFVLRTIEYVRAIPADEFTAKFFEAILTAEFWNPASVAGGSESMAAHLSLYNVISHDMSLTMGSSILYLVQSLIPFLGATGRVQDSYQIYAQALGAPDGQGFNIHFAAGAYLNAGLPGVLLGSLLLLGTWWFVQFCCSRLFLVGRFAIPSLFAYSMFCALMPFAMRGGPEGLKGLFFEGFVMGGIVGVLSVARSRGTGRTRNGESAKCVES